ncbi:response regulator transcription factor [Aestuariibacter sp. A3R04]|uniref:response regulator transcription factor n=1 Tax=Aestuariibacter sp. A3R04 TaxID=2841571 RepID=UPI001C0A173B|nr:response regulator transcription factor [Aestuariibacter sp. A3R04]MBU3021627.1 response regulator transcription factor [Aestuariibacter sp. A3R04]
MQDTILVVEDDADIADLIRVNLRELGVDITLVHNGKTGLALALDEPFSLLILDVTLPEVNGLDICRQVRDKHPEKAIIMLTAKNSETDRVLGLELGADDYMTKPFSVRELQARVRAQLRKVHLLAKSPQGQDAIEEKDITIGALAISIKLHRATFWGKPLDLTATEFDLLLYLANHPNEVFSRAQLLESVWGYQHSGYEHTVNSHINRLRAKIELDATAPKIVQTVWGVGYKLNPDGVQAQ